MWTSCAFWARELAMLTRAPTWSSNIRTVDLRRGLATHLARASASAAAVTTQPPAPTIPRSVADVASDDLPMITLDGRKVAIGWDTRTWSRFHNIWLRDHCRCPECFHQKTKQRLLNTFEIPPDITPSQAEPTPEGLRVSWPSSQPHVSIYPWTWLQKNSYDPPLRQRDTQSEKIIWSSKIQSSPPTVTYGEAMAEDDRGLYKWLSHVDRFGMCFVTGVPPTPEATEELSQRIGFLRETQYGKFWDFTADLAKGDTAYTTLALGAHTDNTYFTDPCGLQLFHLLSHTDGTGGSTLLVDGFYVASILKELHPDAYSILARTPVPAHAAGEPSALYQPYPISGYPVLGHDAVTGELVQVRWNNDDRSVMNHLDPYQVEEWYGAIRIWNKLLTSADSEYWVQLGPGTAVIIDNHRVLHGRSAFTGERRMCGAYIGVDEYRSKLAVLREKFDPVNPPDAHVPERSVWSPAL
ncbi:Trimethyllysine dioxygenase [Mycena crocata]|nr:Trimethyllysine dioxygenase [Mycena crocata]